MPLRVLSLRTKLPLAAAGLILLVGTALSTAAYFAMRKTLLDRANERLVTLTSQLRQTFETQLAQTRARVVATARRPELAAYLRDPSASHREAALRAMAYEGPQAELTRALQLRDADGQIVLASGSPPGTASAPSLGEGDAMRLPRALAGLGSVDSGAFGRLRQDGDSVLFPIAAGLPGSPGGFYVIWRRVSGVTQARDQIARLLGSGAEFHFGNSDGSLWSDLGHPVGPPPVEPARLTGLLRYSRPDRGEVLAGAAPIAGTPWSFTVEFPFEAIYAPARAFLRMLAGIAVGCIALGGLGAWVLSRRLVDPLLHAQVEATRDQLEATVAERTRELRDAQESLVRREKLALLGHLASGVGHEIRNPLGVMNNAIYYLEAIQPDAPAEVREYLGILRNQVGLAGKIVNDMLDFSRTTPAHRQPVQLEQLAEEQLKLVELDGIRVERSFPGRLPPALVDPVHAGQIVHNLLTNARQAMDGGGTLRLRGRADDGVVQLEVADSGPGIPPENLGKIFEPLFTTKARGIGLGLAVSKSLALANGGDLTVASTPGSGAAFTLTVPVAPASR